MLGTINHFLALLHGKNLLTLVGVYLQSSLGVSIFIALCWGCVLLYGCLHDVCPYLYHAWRRRIPLTHRRAETKSRAVIT